MSEVATQNEEQQDVVAPIRDMLDTLVPPDNLEISDVMGNKYELSSFISARSQVKILRIFEELQFGDIDMDFNGSVPEIMTKVLKLVSTDEVMSALDQAFKLSHPLAYSEATLRADEKKIDYQDALDLFPIEEIVRAIIPLFLRLAQTGGQAMAKIGVTFSQPEQQLTTA